MKKDKCNCEGNPFVAIGASLGGIYFAIVISFLILAKEQAYLLSTIAWAFATTAICLGLFALKSIRK